MMPIHRFSQASRGISRGFCTTTLGTLCRSQGSVCGSQADILGRADNLCDAVLMTTSPIGPGAVKTIEHNARNSLLQALQTQKLEVRDIKNHVFVGNTRGLDLVSLSQRLDTKIAAQKSSFEANIAAQKSSFEANIAALQQTISSLQQQTAAEKTQCDETLTALQEKIASLQETTTKRDEMSELTGSSQEQRLRAQYGETLTALQGEIASLRETTAKKNEMSELIESSQQRLQTHQEKIASLQETTTSLQETTTSLQETTTSLQETTTKHNETTTKQNETSELTRSSQEQRIQALSKSSESYLLTRECFISTYRRDHLHNDTKNDRRIIAEGNVAVHGGDMVADASLYSAQSTRRRDDPSTFKKLYGIHPDMVDKIGWASCILF